MLWSDNERCWKLADFGTASEATSKNLNTTRYGRGTAGYRAPEILGENAQFNNKSDIWALGCIVYEICVGQKAFSSDWSVIQYSLTGQINLSPPWPEVRPEFIYFATLRSQVTDMLSLVPSQRPRAEDLVKEWGNDWFVNLEPSTLK